MSFDPAQKSKFLLAFRSYLQKVIAENPEIVTWLAEDECLILQKHLQEKSEQYLFDPEAFLGFIASKEMTAAEVQQQGLASEEQAETYKFVYEKAKSSFTKALQKINRDNQKFL